MSTPNNVKNTKRLILDPKTLSPKFVTDNTHTTKGWKQYKDQYKVQAINPSRWNAGKHKGFRKLTTAG